MRFVVPAGLDDPNRVSGGNVYDRQLADGLAERGWQVELASVSSGDDVALALRSAARGTSVLVDGLVAALDPSALEVATRAGSRVIVLAHMLSEAFAAPDLIRVAGERRALRGADAVVATSRWTAAEIVARGIVQSDRISVALPGATDGPQAHGDPSALLSVGVIAPHKGQDILLDALRQIGDLDWTCTLVGSGTADPEFAVRIAAEASALEPRVRLTGALGAQQLGAAYESAGLLVVPSRTEAFGMVIGDARRRGLPVLAAETGGIPEAAAGGGSMLVAVDDASAFADALRRWLTDAPLRDQLHSELMTGAADLPTWSDTVADVEKVLVAA